MGNIVPASAQLPAHLAARAAALVAKNAALAGGIKDMSFARLNIGGGKFHYITKDGEKQTFNDPNNPNLPKMQMELSVLDGNPAVSKVFYINEKEDGKDGTPPDCSSEDGITPDANIATPQHTNCATCPKNQWGSKISKASGKQVKACGDSKTVVVIPVADPNWTGDEEAFVPMSFKIPATSLKDWKAYLDGLAEAGLPIEWVETQIRFDPTVNYPKPTFHFGRVLEQDEIEIVEEAAAREEVKRITSPRKAGNATQAAAPAAPAAPRGPIGSHPTDAPPHGEVVRFTPPLPPGTTETEAWADRPPLQQAAAPAAPPAPAPAPAPAGAKTITPRKRAPKTAEAPAVAPAPAAPPAPPAPVDPFAGMPAYVKAAVDGAGGYDSPVGRGVYDSLTVALRPAAPAAAPVAPPVYAPPPAPVSQGVSGLDDLLRAAMATT